MFLKIIFFIYIFSKELSLVIPEKEKIYTSYKIFTASLLSFEIHLKYPKYL